MKTKSEYTYGYDLTKESYPERMERAKREEESSSSEDFYEGYLRPSKHRELIDILEQIRSYPTPISDCDVNYNWLLEERARLQANQ